MARDFDHIWLGMGMDQYQTTIHIPLSTFWPFCSIFALFFFVFGIITDFNLCPVGALNVGSQTCKGCKLVGGWWKSQRRPGGNHAASFFFSFSAQRNAKKAIMDLLNHTEPAICWWFIHVYTTHLVLWRRVYYYSTNMISQQFVGWDELHGVMGKPHGGSWTSSQSAEAATGILFHGLHTPDDLARLHLDFSLVHCLFLCLQMVVETGWVSGSKGVLGNGFHHFYVPNEETWALSMAQHGPLAGQSCCCCIPNGNLLVLVFVWASWFGGLI